MKPLVIFGAGKVAEVVYYYFAHESRVEIAGITCNRDFICEPTFCGREIVPFEEIESVFPPSEVEIFVAIGYHNMNDLRAERVADARAKGYRLASFIHRSAELPEDTELGENCFIMNNVLIQPRVRLGNNVFVWSGALIGHHSVIGHNNWVTSAAAICGDVTVGDNCFFAANSTVGNGVRIGNRCFLGAGTLITKDLGDGSVVVQKSSPKISLNSDQFVRMSTFR